MQPKTILAIGFFLGLSLGGIAIYSTFWTVCSNNYYFGDHDKGFMCFTGRVK